MLFDYVKIVAQICQRNLGPGGSSCGPLRNFDGSHFSDYIGASCGTDVTPVLLPYAPELGESDVHLAAG